MAHQQINEQMSNACSKLVLAQRWTLGGAIFAGLMAIMTCYLFFNDETSAAVSTGITTLFLVASVAINLRTLKAVKKTLLTSAMLQGGSSKQNDDLGA